MPTIEVDADYDAGAKFYDSEMRRAAKEHVCCECGTKIQAGERYEHVAGKWDKVEVFKTCSLCAEIRNHFSGGGFCHGSLWEGVHEYVYGNFYSKTIEEVAEVSSWLDGLSDEAKKEVLRRYEEEYVRHDMDPF